jgi:predicted PurR-regulated permease PerM
VVVVGLALFVWVIWRFQSLISPLVLALILAYLLNPLVTQLMRRTGMQRGTAVLIVYVVVLLAWLTGAVALGFVAVEQFSRLTSLLPDSMTEFMALVQKQIEAIRQYRVTIAGYTFSGEMVTSRIDFNALARQAVTLIQPALRQTGSWAAQLASATISSLATGFLIFVVSLYMAKDSPQFGRTLSELAHQPGYQHDVERLLRDFTKIWDAYLRGQVILGLVIGVLVALTLSMLGVNNALGLGVLSGVLEFLPIIGPLIATGAAVLVALFQDANWLGMSAVNYALAVLAVMIIIQQLENNLLVPRIVGDALDLHPLVVMISVLMGASLAGILGAILAAPVVASLKLLGAYAWRKLLDLPPFPDPEPPPKPGRGKMGLAARWRLWRMRLGRRG